MFIAYFTYFPFEIYLPDHLRKTGRSLSLWDFFFHPVRSQLLHLQLHLSRDYQTCRMSQSRTWVSKGSSIVAPRIGSFVLLWRTGCLLACRCRRCLDLVTIWIYSSSRISGVGLVDWIQNHWAELLTPLLCRNGRLGIRIWFSSSPLTQVSSQWS